MRDIGVVKIHCISKVLSPLTHMMETAGNESIINREKIFHRGLVKSIPVISGNAIRHKMLREPGSIYLVEALGLKGELSIDQANYMFYGGALTESTISENMKVLAGLKELFPLYRLLGGSLRNQIIAGSITVQRGILICEENREVLEASLPEGYSIPQEALKSNEEFIKEYQYTRSDIQKSREGTEILKPEELESGQGTNLMIYSGQCIIPGSLFYHGFILTNISRLEVGAFFYALQDWKDAGGIIGGYSRIGHGRLDMNFVMEDSEDFLTAANIENCISEYLAHIEINKDRCVKWLMDNFKDGKKK
jgi:hypothetical protein